MSKSALYTAMTSATAVAVGGTVPLGTTIRRFGTNCQLSGDGILVNGVGYYDTTTSITLFGTTAGDTTVTLYKDGVAIPGATATATLTASGYQTITIPAIVRLTCCGSGSTLSYVLSGTAQTVANVAAVIEKI